VAIETTFDCHDMTMTKSDPTMTKTTFNCHSLVAIEKKKIGGK
jgi:hypothetical protein